MATDIVMYPFNLGKPYAIHNEDNSKLCYCQKKQAF